MSQVAHGIYSAGLDKLLHTVTCITWLHYGKPRNHVNEWSGDDLICLLIIEE